MGFRHPLARLFQGFKAGCKTQHPRKKLDRLRPLLELLEDRVLLSRTLYIDTGDYFPAAGWP